jgi:hypothetical protein
MNVYTYPRRWGVRTSSHLTFSKAELAFIANCTQYTTYIVVGLSLRESSPTWQEAFPWYFSYHRDIHRYLSDIRPCSQPTNQDMFTQCSSWYRPRGNYTNRVVTTPTVERFYTGTLSELGLCLRRRSVERTGRVSWRFTARVTRLVGERRGCMPIGGESQHARYPSTRSTSSLLPTPHYVVYHNLVWCACILVPNSLILLTSIVIRVLLLFYEMKPLPSILIFIHSK